MPIKAKHRASRRSRIQKYCWVAGTLGAAVGAMGKGDWDQSLSAPAPQTGSTGYPSSYYPELETINLHPVAAIRLLENLFIDAGLDATSPNLAANPYYASYPLNGNEGFESHMTADDGGWRWGNISLNWQLSKHQHLFLTYRSPVEADGSTHFTTDPMETGEFSGNASPVIEFPTVVGLGYGFELTDTISLETDVQWLDFSSYQSFDLGAANDPVLLTMGAKSASAPENPRNILASGVGGDWKFADHWVLRARYQYFENPNHSSSFSPSIPDVNQHVITLGVAWKGKRSSLEVAYAMDFYYDLHIANDQQPSFNGTYGFAGHLLSLAYKFTF